MAIKVTVKGSVKIFNGKSQETPKEDLPPTEQPPKMSLVARKSIDGHIMILDHSDIDIIIIPADKKIVIYPKESFRDAVYAAQERLFRWLGSNGVIDRDSVQGGNVYGSMQASYPDAVDGVDATQMVVFSVGKFMEDEKPHLNMEKYYEEMMEKELTNPDEDDSTELGEVPQEAKKGSIDPGRIRRYMSGYGFYE